MLDTHTHPGVARRLWESLHQDLQGLLAALAPPPDPAPGLYTYRLSPPGGQIRLHLRVEREGSGVLFVDVTDVVHLNPTATQMVKLALEGVPLASARAVFSRRYPGVSLEHLAAELAQAYALAGHFSHPAGGCATCGVPFLKRTPVFSTPVHAPYKADLALTYGCNNQCAHCYNEPERLPMASLPFESWQTILDRLVAVGVPHLIFTGGEATLHPDLPALIAYADQLGPIVGLNTNGRRMAHRPYVQTLVEAGLNHVQITLGSHDPDVHDEMMGATSFHQTVRGIENALDSPLHVITNTTLMRSNMDQVEETIDFLYALGIRTFAMNGMIYSGGGFAHPQAIPEDEMPPLLVRVRERAEKHGMRFLWYTPTEYCRMSPVELEVGIKRCNAGEYSLCVEPNGDVLPCQSYYVAAGNLLRDPWEQIWNGELFRSFRERELDPAWAGLPRMCWDCPDLPLCGGGCRIERQARQGQKVAESPEAALVSCGLACGAGHNHASAQQAGFLPTEGMVRTGVRSSGNSPGLIPLAALDVKSSTSAQPLLPEEGSEAPGNGAQP